MIVIKSVVVKNVLHAISNMLFHSGAPRIVYRPVEVIKDFLVEQPVVSTVVDLYIGCKIKVFFFPAPRQICEKHLKRMCSESQEFFHNKCQDHQYTNEQCLAYIDKNLSELHHEIKGCGSIECKGGGSITTIEIIGKSYHAPLVDSVFGLCDHN